MRFNNVLQILRLLAISYEHHSHCNICLILWMFRPLCFSQYGPFHQILRTDKEVSRVFICGDPRPHSTCSSNLLHSVGNKHSTLSLVSDWSKLEQHWNPSTGILHQFWGNPCTLLSGTSETELQVTHQVVQDELWFPRLAVHVGTLTQWDLLSPFPQRQLHKGRLQKHTLWTMHQSINQSINQSIFI